MLARGMVRRFRLVNVVPAVPAERRETALALPARAATPRASAPGGPAVLVGITAAAGSGTTLTMLPADLTRGPEADITAFTVSLDAGTY